MRLESRAAALGLVAAIALWGTSCAVEPAPLSPDGTWRLSGTITNTTGATIAGARLTVIGGANKDVQVTTDSAGRYAFGSLQSGTFNVLIEAGGHASITPRVDLFRDIDVNFALAVNP